MTDIQREAYEGNQRIKSDPLGLLDRDNRNHRKKRELIEEHAYAEPGDRVLEVGCGHGIHAKEYAQKYQYHGIDLSESLVTQTQKAVEGTTAVAHQGNALDLEYADNTFQSVFGTAILHHLDDPERALEEWMRVTEPGGSVTLMEPNYLFPKDLIATHLQPEERHKINMAPWRLDEILSSVSDEFEISPQVHTPPYPSRASGLYDKIDSWMSQIPIVKWSSQLILINVIVE